MSSKNKEFKENLNKFLEGMKDLSSNNQQIYRPYQELYNSINNPVKLDEKTKILMSIAIGTYSQNETMLLYFIKEAYKLGVTEEEITEAAFVAVISGGLPAMNCCVTLVKDAVEALKEQ